MITQKYITTILQKNKRMDGRKPLEYRPIKVEYGVSEKSAEGSAMVTMGETKVIAGVKLGVGEPYPDRPDEGTIIVNVELVPLASPEFETGPPSIKAIELARVVDRGIRESKTIDFKKLCIKSGEKTWLVFIDIYPINAAGNLFDAASLATLAALKTTKFPKLEEGEKANYKEHTEEGLPLTKQPLECTIYKIGQKFIIDPTSEEEKAVIARLTVAISENGKICAVQKGGGEPLSEEEIDQMIIIAEEKTKELRAKL